MSNLKFDLLKTQHVIGVKVINTEEENLGKIEELVIDKYSGKVVYAVLSFGGLFGLGDKLFALPWDVLSFNADKEAFILNKQKEALQEAPGFDKDNWPNMSDATWQRNLHDYYNHHISN